MEGSKSDPPADHLSAGQLFEEMEGDPLQIQESQVIVPKKGKLFAEDGSLKVAVIRPCVSRGKRIRGLPPIYTAAMLAENAGVFTDWPMYEDHVAEQSLESFREQLMEASMGEILEWLEERARQIKELGGRVERSYFNPELTFKTDRDEGYQPGGVEAVVFPQPRVKAMLEADPKILHNSINAWPSGAQPGTAPWDPATKGMVIEGIRPKPRGSVDWVYRGGAGGRPLLAEEDAAVAVSLLEAVYSADHQGTGPLSEDEKLKKQLKDVKPGELRDFLKEEGYEHLIPALAEESKDPPEPKGGNGGGITMDQLTEALGNQKKELEASFEEKLEEHDEQVEEEVQNRLSSHTQSERLAARASELISEAQNNGLPKEYADGLRSNYALLPSGPAQGIRVQEADLKVTEGEGDSAKEVTLTPEGLVEHRIREDVKHCAKLIEAAGGTPRIKGLGPSAPDPGNDGGKEGGGSKPAVRNSRFRQHLAESGMLEAEDDKDERSEDERVKDYAAGAGSR